jgi:cephalosporin-C deacetylase-like acetyl esterase
MARCDPLYGYYTGVNEIPADLDYAIYLYTDLVLKVRGQSSIRMLSLSDGYLLRVSVRPSHTILGFWPVAMAIDPPER